MSTPIVKEVTRKDLSQIFDDDVLSPKGEYVTKVHSKAHYPTEYEFSKASFYWYKHHLLAIKEGTTYHIATHSIFPPSAVTRLNNFLTQEGLESYRI